MRRERGDVIETVSVLNRWKLKNDGPYHSYVRWLCVSTHWAELQVAAKYDILSELINAGMIGQMFPCEEWWVVWMCGGMADDDVM